MKDTEYIDVEDLKYDELDNEEDWDDDFYGDYEVYDHKKPRVGSSASWTSLILGIIASLGWIVPFIGLPITIVGTVLGAMNMKNAKAKGAAIAGFIINLVFLCATIAKGIVDCVLYAKRSKNCKN